MSVLRCQVGMTLVELVIGMAISALVVSIVASAIGVAVWLPANRGNEMAVQQDVLNAHYWITHDASLAQDFTAGISPVYGTLTWTDYTTTTVVSYAVTYTYDEENGYLVRTELQNGLPASGLAVAKNVARAEDVAFVWSPSNYVLQATITSTVAQADPIEGVTTVATGAVITGTTRPRVEAFVFPPSEGGAPPAPPGFQELHAANDPVLLTGSFVAGGASELQNVDGVYYEVDSTSGSPKAVVYTIASPNITLQGEIKGIQVLFVGQSDKKNTTLNLYVQDSPAGFPSTSDGGYTFTGADQNQTVAFQLNATALAYVNSQITRTVNLKVAAVGNPEYQLKTDEIVFVAWP